MRLAALRALRGTPATAEMLEEAVRETMAELCASRCQGVHLNVPAPALLNYPHGIHVRHPSLAFEFSTGTGSLHAVAPQRCEQLRLTAGGSSPAFVCGPCTSMAQANKRTIGDLEHRATQRDLHLTTINDCYLTPVQQASRKAHYNKKQSEIQLALLGKNRKLSTALRRVQSHKLLLQMLSQNNSMRTHAFLAQQVKRGRSPASMVGMLSKYIEHQYKVAGYTCKELDLYLLVWRWGGKRLVHALAREEGFATLNTIKRHHQSKEKFQVCPGLIEKPTVEANMNTFLFEPAQTTAKPACLHHLVMDDVKGNKQLTAHESGHVRGLCYHAALNKVPTHVTRWEDIEAIQAALQSGEAHFASEFTTVGLVANRRSEYHPKICGVSAGCQTGDPPERVRSLLSTVIELYVNDPRGQESMGMLATIQPDGAASFAKVAHQLFFSAKMDDGHQLYKHLKPLQLMNLHCGEGVYRNIAPGCEHQHTGKRFKERIKSKTKGVQIGDVVFKRGTLKGLLESARVHVGATIADIGRMFGDGFCDAMRVEPMVKMLQALAVLPTLEPSVFGNQAAPLRKLFVDGLSELKIFGRVCSLTVTLVADIRPTLSEQLTNVSELSHLLLALYRRNGSKFIASQTYRNKQCLLRSIYWSVATCLEYGYKEYQIWQDAGALLELFFCDVRAMFPGSCFALGPFEARVHAAMEVQSALARNPEWRKASRHLATTDARGSRDHQNSDSFLRSGAGEIDERRVRVGKTAISLTNCWGLGARNAAHALTVNKIFTGAEVDWAAIAAAGCDMLRPRGKWVGVRVPVGAARAAGPAATHAHGAPGVDHNEPNADVPGSDHEQPDADDCEEAREGEGAPGPKQAAECERAVQFEDEDMEVGVVGQHRGVKIDVPGLGSRTLATALRLAFDGWAAKGAAGRTERYMGKTQGGQLLADAGERKVWVLQTVATLVLMDSGAVVGAVVAIGGFRSDVSTVLQEDCVSESDFTTKAGLLAVGKVLSLVSSADGKKLHWDGKTLGESVVFECQWSHLLNPEVNEVADTSRGRTVIRPAHDYDLRAVELAISELWAKAAATCSGKTLQLPPARTWLPYTGSGQNLLVPVGSAGVTLSVRRSTQGEDDPGLRMVRCGFPHCQELFPQNKMRHHAAYHLVWDPSSSSMQMPCGLCGCNDASQWGDDGQRNGGCAAWLDIPKNKSSRIIPHVRCVLLGDNEPAAMGYQHPRSVASKKPAASAPSTNHLIKCPECKVSAQYFWKLRGLQSHWDAAHSGVTMPTGLVQELVITPEEKTWLRYCRTWNELKRKKANAVDPSNPPAGTPSIPAAAAAVRGAAGTPSPLAHGGLPDGCTVIAGPEPASASSRAAEILASPTRSTTKRSPADRATMGHTPDASTHSVARTSAESAGSTARRLDKALEAEAAPAEPAPAEPAAEPAPAEPAPAEPAATRRSSRSTRGKHKRRRED